MTSPRRWWQRMEAQRRQVARWIADRVGARWPDTSRPVLTFSVDACALALLDRSQPLAFDVHRARQVATSEAALADDIDEHEAIVHDWRAEKRGGVHPANVPGLPPGAPHDVLNWRARARAGRLVLDVLDGRCPWAPGGRQPSWCDRCGHVTISEWGVELSDGEVTSMNGGRSMLCQRGTHQLGTVLHSKVDRPVRASAHLIIEGPPGTKVRVTVGAAESVHMLNGPPQLIEVLGIPVESDGVLSADLGIEVEIACDNCHGTGHNLAGRIPPIRLSSPYLASGSRDYARLVWKAGDVATAAEVRWPDTLGVAEPGRIVRVDAGVLAVQRWLGCTRAQANTLIMLARADGFRSTGRPEATDERPLAWLAEVERCLAEGAEVPEHGRQHTRSGHRDRGEPAGVGRLWWWAQWVPRSTMKERHARHGDAWDIQSKPTPGGTVDLMPRWAIGADRTHRMRSVRRVLMSTGRGSHSEITFARLGYLARGDGHDCEACGGSGRSSDGMCDECFGRGRIETVTVQLPGAIHETVVTTTLDAEPQE